MLLPKYILAFPWEKIVETQEILSSEVLKNSLANPVLGP